jgi:hypothetical protein
MAKKIGFIKLQIRLVRQIPRPSVRAGSARSEHHGVLQGVQRADSGHGAWSAGAGGDHRLRGQELHLRDEVAAGDRPDQEGWRHQGFAKPHTDKVGKITRAQAEEIAKAKNADLTAADLDAAVRTIAGSARSMGITVEGL